MKIKTNKDYLLLAFSFVLIIIMVILAVYLTQKEIGGPQKKAPITTPPETVQRVKYKSGTLGKAFDKLVNRVPLTSPDLAVKNRVISQAGESGLIIRTEKYVIEYVRAMDDFEIEILTTDIEVAKREAEAYLKSQGFSSQGLCNLPARFYLNFEVSKIISPQVVFDPLPQGC
ncbi:MAG: hypothetical protein HYW63_01930 [Candidatus Levybacteria bacterium]|nr:hypothetical protein [Candidatus Levybacteria bacterium]